VRVTRLLGISNTTQLQLQAGEIITGHVWLPEDERTEPATLRWSPDDGATVQLVAPTADWAVSFESDSFALHMRVSGGGELSLLDTRVRGMTADDRISTVGAYTLVLGGHVYADDTWPFVRYSTASLTEWRADSGIQHALSKRAPYVPRVTWKRPSDDVVPVADGELRFAGTMTSTSVRHTADWSMHTWQVMTVRPTEALTIDTLHRRFAQPLLALVVFASDRPDALTEEVLTDADQTRSVAVWRVGRQLEPREWELPPKDAFLFHAGDLADYPKAITTWWALHEEVWPALGIFAEHVCEANVYSPSRLLMLYSALDGYTRARFGRNNDIKGLRDFAGVPHDVTGLDKQGLALLGYCRGHFAHLRLNSRTLTPKDAEAGAFPSIRRASALMQAVLLRELGLDAPATEAILRQHYAAWPIP
jgi:hypothetical protein